jgi:hypothetical protein
VCSSWLNFTRDDETKGMQPASLASVVTAGRNSVSENGLTTELSRTTKHHTVKYNTGRERKLPFR